MATEKAKRKVVLSKEARAKISEAAKARWAEFRKEAKAKGVSVTQMRNSRPKRSASVTSKSALRDVRDALEILERLTPEARAFVKGVL